MQMIKYFLKFQFNSNFNKVAKAIYNKNKIPCVIPIGNNNVLYNSKFKFLVTNIFENNTNKETPSNKATILKIFIMIKLNKWHNRKLQIVRIVMKQIKRSNVPKI